MGSSVRRTRRRRGREAGPCREQGQATPLDGQGTPGGQGGDGGMRASRNVKLVIGIQRTAIDAGGGLLHRRDREAGEYHGREAGDMKRRTRGKAIFLAGLFVFPSGGTVGAAGDQKGGAGDQHGKAPMGSMGGGVVLRWRG